MSSGSKALTVPSAHPESRAYTAAEGVGKTLGRIAVTFFGWTDRCLEASLCGRVSQSVARVAASYYDGSVIFKFLWTYAKLMVAPFGERLGVETFLGLTLALACVAPTEILMAAAVGTLVLFLWDRARKVRAGMSDKLWVLPKPSILVAAGASLFFIIGATASSVDPSKSLFNMIIWFFYFAVFFLATDAAARGRAELVIWPLLTGSAFSGLVSVYQKLTGWIPPKTWVDVSFEDDIVRMVGTFTNPTFFAEMMGLTLPLTIALFLRKRDWRDHVVLLGFAGLQGIGLLLSSSRGAWLGFGISFCILAVLYDWRMLPLGLAVGAVGFALAPPVLLERLLSSFSFTDSSNAYRVFIWRGSFAVLRDNLFRGVGLGAESFSKVYPEYMIIQTPAPHAHSTFLEYLIEVGLFGFLAMACFLVIWGAGVLRTVWSRKGKGSARWAEVCVLAASIAAIGGNMLQGAIDYTWYSPKVTSVFWAIVGLGAGLTAGVAGASQAKAQSQYRARARGDAE